MASSTTHIISTVIITEYVCSESSAMTVVSTVIPIFSAATVISTKTLNNCTDSK